MFTSLRQVLRKKPNVLFAVDPDTPVVQAVQVMVEQRIGSVVVQEREFPVGMFTERDVLERVVDGRLDPQRTPVREVMTTPVETASPQDTVGQTIERMTRTRHCHMPVVDEGRVLAVISLGDLTRSLSDAQQRDIRLLSSFIHGPGIV